MSQALLIYKEEKKTILNTAARYFERLQGVRIEVFNFSLLLAAAFLLVAHLVTANLFAVSSYGKNTAYKTIESLQVEIRRLNLELTKTRSIGFLKEASGRFNLVANDSIQYVQSSSGWVALNK